MSEEDYSPVASVDEITYFDKSPKTEEAGTNTKNKNRDDTVRSGKRTPLLGRFPSFQSALRPNFRTVGTRLRKLSCLRKEEDEEIPMLEVPRHKSIDIGVGLARRVSLFLFTRRTVCVHPYHPYTPQQTTRKINFGFDEKIK